LTRTPSHWLQGGIDHAAMQRAAMGASLPMAANPGKIPPASSTCRVIQRCSCACLLPPQEQGTTRYPALLHQISRSRY